MPRLVNRIINSSIFCTNVVNWALDPAFRPRNFKALLTVLIVFIQKVQSLLYYSFKLLLHLFTCRWVQAGFQLKHQQKFQAVLKPYPDDNDTIHACQTAIREPEFQKSPADFVHQQNTFLPNYALIVRWSSLWRSSKLEWNNGWTIVDLDRFSPQLKKASSTPRIWLPAQLPQK